MKPTIGRIVYFYDNYNHVRPAIVTAVHKDESTLDLFVIYPTRSDSIQKVRHDEDHEKETWDWMPYQKGQAKKTEEVNNSIHVHIHIHIHMDNQTPEEVAKIISEKMRKTLLRQGISINETHW